MKISMLNMPKILFLVISFILIITALLKTNILHSYSNLEEIRQEKLPEIKEDLSKKNLVLGNDIFVRIFKKESELELWIKKDKKFILYKTYPICNYSGHLGPKIKEGDGQSPEGFYYVPKSMLHPTSLYHLAFNIGFPNEYDKANGRTGSYIMVHGDCVSIGCYAMTDEKIEEIYLIAENSLKNKQKFFRVHIFPFRMNKENMGLYKGHKWYGFWKNIKEGFDLFEKYHIVPDVTVENKKYKFSVIE